MRRLLITCTALIAALATTAHRRLFKKGVNSRRIIGVIERL